MHTVNKQQSLNLLFSSMFCIKSKIVKLGWKKTLRFINNKFMSNLKIFALLLKYCIWKIMLVVKYDEKYVHGPLI